jgi:hypothetical protein
MQYESPTPGTKIRVSLMLTGGTYTKKTEGEILVVAGPVFNGLTGLIMYPPITIDGKEVIKEYVTYLTPEDRIYPW